MTAPNLVPDGMLSGCMDSVHVETLRDQVVSVIAAAIASGKRPASETTDRALRLTAAWLREQAEAGDKAILNALPGSCLKRDLAAGVVTLNRAADALDAMTAEQVPK